jgi:hypothetical protein
MKTAAFFLLLAGWLLVLAALAMLPVGATAGVNNGVNNSAARNGFVLAGLGVQLTGFAIAVRAHMTPSGRK